jgi:signal recognition particle GTPase
VPIRFIGIGEAAEDLDEFRAGPFIDALIGVGGEAAPS